MVYCDGGVAQMDRQDGRVYIALSALQTRVEMDINIVRWMCQIGWLQRVAWLMRKNLTVKISPRLIFKTFETL